MNRYQDPGIFRRVQSRIGPLFRSPVADRDVVPTLDLREATALRVYSRQTLDLSLAITRIIAPRPGHLLRLYSLEKQTTVSSVSFLASEAGVTGIRLNLPTTATAIGSYAGGLDLPPGVGLWMEQANVADTAIVVGAIFAYMPVDPGE